MLVLRAQHPAVRIHITTCNQGRRLCVQEFKAGSSPVMLATDVAARGLGRPTYHVLPHDVCISRSHGAARECICPAG